ncbi:MAG: SufS family cysteine desulfurase [archaeon]
MNIDEVRKDFPILEKKIDGKPIIYLDNAATSLKPIQVIDAIKYYYSEATANIHRGAHKLSDEASEAYEKCHERIASFIGAKKEEFVFCKNTTEAINGIAISLQRDNFFHEGDEILVSKMEHHSNLVPWQMAAKYNKAKLNFIEVKEDFSLDLEDLEKKVNEKTKLIAVAHASNTIGTINPVKEISKIAHDHNALILVDAAQSVPHMEVNAKKMDADFLAFSGHKMLGPTSSGGFYGRKELLEKIPPFFFGGGMIQEVSLEGAKWTTLPWKFEAGTPGIGECIGLGKAVEYLKKIGMNEVRKHEKELIKYSFKKLEEINSAEKLIFYNPRDEEKQVGILLFEAKGIEAHDLALALDETENIAVRSGMHCAEPLVSSYNEKGLVRGSFYLYNSKEEIDLFSEALDKVIKTLG